MPPIEEAFVPGHAPSARMRDRTIDVDSVELEVIDAPGHVTRSWIGGGTLLAVSVSLVVGTAAFFVLDDTPLSTFVAPYVTPSPRVPKAPALPSLTAPEAEETPVVAQPVEQVAAESTVPPAQEANPAAESKVAQAPEKPVRKRSHAKRTRMVTTTSSRTVTKRTHRQ